jgi:hypothetical protein
MNNRIIYSKNGALQDASLVLNNFYSGTKAFDYIAGQDYIYIGARMPFNHIYIKMGAVVNAVISCAIRVEYFDGVLWRDVVEVIDDTNQLTKSGVIQFTPNKRYSWTRRSTKDEGEVVAGLDTITIYDRYWLRISFTQDLTPAVEIDWVGNIFAEDMDLYGEFPEFAKAAFKAGFKLGKLDWFEQHAIAGKLVVDELSNLGVIQDKGQILDWRNFTLAAVSKCAEVIYNSMGDDYLDQRNSAREEFKARVSKRNALTDQNNDAIEQPDEVVNTTGWLSR